MTLPIQDRLWLVHGKCVGDGSEFNRKVDAADRHKAVKMFDWMYKHHAVASYAVLVAE